ncbi:caspase family protein [Bradyrhizobium sp.]|uniref:caspase family protein n=1 Tax=Bradyrhizobium sp. TaxID=376 RepID=UPI003C748C81
MQRLLKISLAFLAFLAVVSLPAAGAAASEKRLALVIGNASYKAKALANPVNDAALIAQTLQAAGFDVMGARDLDEGLLRQTFRDFTDRVTNAGPDAVAAVFFAGYGLQFEGENYLVPIDANIGEASDVPVRAVRLSDQMHALAALHLKTTFIIMDVARASSFGLPGLAAGLAWVEPEANMLIAFNAAPGTVAPVVGEGYGPYAKALAEMIREGNLTPANLFGRVRLRVNELTKGAQVPWDASNIETQFKFFERAPGAPRRADAPERTARMRAQPMRVLGAHDAYMVALMRDTFDAYADFLADYWQDPMTRRVSALLAARREAITWRRTYQANVSDAYWSYLERYPRGPHVADARRLLTHLGAAIAPPPKFARMDCDVPPPLPDELEYVERSVLVLDDPAFAFEPPQPSPVYFLEPPPPEFLDLKPPGAPSGAHTLPAPTFVPLPVYVRLPAEVVAPNPLIFSNARESINTTNDATAKPDGQAASSPISPPRGGDNRAGSARLAPSVAAKATVINSPSPPPSAVSQVARVEIKPPLAAPSPAASLMPPWLTDITTPVNRGIEPPTLTTESDVPIPAPTMFAPPSSGLTLRTWSYGIPSSPTTVRVPLPIPRSVAHARLRTGLPPEMPSPQTTGSIPPSVPRSVTLAPPATRNPSKPVANAASTPSPIRTDQAKQPKTPPLNRPASSTQVARTPKESPGGSPPTP